MSLYAVRSGRQTGIFTLWSQVKPLVEGFSGAEYRKYRNSELEIAKSYLNQSSELDLVWEKSDCYVSYIAGSYDEESGVYGSGCLLFSGDGELITTLTYHGSDARFTSNGSLTGEIFGALNGLNWARARDDFLEIRYYSDSVSEWANGLNEVVGGQLSQVYYLATQQLCPSPGLVKYVKTEITPWYLRAKTLADRALDEGLLSIK